MRRHWGMALAMLSACIGFLTLATTAGEIEPGSPARVNLVVYYDYDEQNPEVAEAFFQVASARLYEATEGQMALGKIEVHVDCPAKKGDADVIISQGDSRGNAVVGGFFGAGAIRISQFHILSPGNDPSFDGTTSFMHELGHYLFFLYDEYHGDTVNTTIPGHVIEVEVPPGSVQLTDSEGNPVGNPFLFFCSHENGQGIACYMNSGFDSNIGKREYCTQFNSTRHNRGVATNVGTGINIFADETGDLHRTQQEALSGKACWQTMEVALGSRGVTITPPGQEGAVTTGGSPGNIDFEVKECNPGVALVLDRSGSMDGARLANMKRSAVQVVGLLDDGTELGIVTYSSNPSVVFPIQPLDDTNRAQAVAAVQSLSASGSTNIGGGILSGLGLLTAGDPNLEPDVIVLLTDGEHNTGTDPATATAQVVAAGVTLSTVGLGTSIDVDLLKTLSEQTGGFFIFVEDEKDLASAIVQQSSSVQGDATIASERGTLTPGETIQFDVPVDVYSSQLSISSSWNLGDLEVVVTGPSGQQLNDIVQQTDDSIVFKVTEPAAGNYTVQLRADGGNSTDLDYDLQVLARSAELFFVANVVQTGPFPAPLKIEAFPSVPGYTVGGANVKAVVRDPQGQTTELQLFDDGSQGHGDIFRNDGTYTNLFTRFNGNGSYEIEIIVDNVNGYTRPGFEVVPNFTSEEVSAFRREIRTSLNVEDFEDLGDASLTFVEETNQLDDYTIETQVSESYQLRFRLMSGSGQPVRLDTLRFESTGTGDETLVTARLFIDSNGDGLIDAEGPTSLPAATGTFNTDDGELLLGDSILLQPDETVHFILTYRLPPPVNEAGLPILVLLLVGTGVLLVKRQRIVALVTIVFLVSWVSGCGDGQDGFVFTQPSGSPVTEVTAPAAPVTFTARLVEVQAQGSINGKTVEVDGFQAVQGPTVTIYR